jgi:hypothetical protein
MSPELAQALRSVCSMKCPSVALLLRISGYEYEAQELERLVAVWEASQREGGQHE